MIEHWLSLHTVDPVIATSTSATLGTSACLPYLPGSLLLGAVAARLYSKHPDQAEALLQTGRVRFGDGRLVASQRHPSLPMPLSFHHPKAKQGPEHWRNHVVERPNGQAVQLRGGFLTGSSAPDALPLRPRFSSSERSALQGGMARHGFLYSLQALDAGQLFLARVVFDGVDPTMVEHIKQLLQGELVLGRSRSAEFGRVRTGWVSAPASIPLATAPMEGSRVPILALSDWCLIHPDTGSPSFRLTPAMVGLPPDAFEVDTARCFLRTRSWSPYNAFRRRPDHERSVLVQGSVITVTLKNTTLDALRTAFALGVGEHRRDGLGEALVAPLFLTQATYEPWLRAPSQPEVPRHRLRDDSIMVWARQRHTDAKHREEALQRAREWRSKLGRGPSHSQWGRVRRLALRHTDHTALVQCLKEELVDQESRRSRWGSTGPILFDFVKGDSTYGVRALQILAALMVRTQEPTP